MGACHTCSSHVQKNYGNMEILSQREGKKTGKQDAACKSDKVNLLILGAFSRLRASFRGIWLCCLRFVSRCFFLCLHKIHTSAFYFPATFCPLCFRSQCIGKEYLLETIWYPIQGSLDRRGEASISANHFRKYNWRNEEFIVRWFPHRRENCYPRRTSGTSCFHLPQNLVSCLVWYMCSQTKTQIVPYE